MRTWIFINNDIRTIWRSCHEASRDKSSCEASIEVDITWRAINVWSREWMRNLFISEVQCRRSMQDKKIWKSKWQFFQTGFIRCITTENFVFISVFRRKKSYSRSPQPNLLSFIRICQSLPLTFVMCQVMLISNNREKTSIIIYFPPICTRLRKMRFSSQERYISIQLVELLQNSRHLPLFILFNRMEICRTQKNTKHKYI